MNTLKIVNIAVYTKKLREFVDDDLLHSQATGRFDENGNFIDLLHTGILKHITSDRELIEAKQLEYGICRFYERVRRDIITPLCSQSMETLIVMHRTCVEGTWQVRSMNSASPTRIYQLQFTK